MIANFTDADVTDQTGKIVFITGANTGIGFEAAKVLAHKGARVLLGCRSEEKAGDAADRIRHEHPHAEVDGVILDLGDLASVRAAAAQVCQEPRLDCLVNNAGVGSPRRQATKDGFELQFGVNHLGHFALTGLLASKLEETAGSRIVCTSSNGHRSGQILFDDLRAEKSYSMMQRYAMSKLANLLHMYELDRRLRSRHSSTIAVGAHPGGAATDLSRHFPKMLNIIVLPIVRVLLNSAAQGAWSTLLAVAAPGVEGGQYFGPGGWREMAGPAKQVDSTALSKDPQLAARLWDVSVEQTGVDPGI